MAAFLQGIFEHASNLVCLLAKCQLYVLRCWGFWVQQLHRHLPPFTAGWKKSPTGKLQLWQYREYWEKKLHCLAKKRFLCENTGGRRTMSKHAICSSDTGHLIGELFQEFETKAPVQESLLDKGASFVDPKRQNMVGGFCSTVTKRIWKLWPKEIGWDPHRWRDIGRLL